MKRPAERRTTASVSFSVTADKALVARVKRVKAMLAESADDFWVEETNGNRR